MQDTVYISGLEPLVAPEKVAFWPPAPGWYAVGAFLLVALILLLLAWIRRRRANKYRILALNQLKSIAETAGQQAGQGDLQALNRLLKETALTIYPREQVAALYGKVWLEFLDQHCKGTHFSDQHGSLLDSTTFISKQQVAIPAEYWERLLADAETWIRKHNSN